MANDLLIQINADAKNAQKAFDDIRKQTEDLENQLGKVAQISGVAFAALTATIGVSIAAFIGAKRSADELTLALQNQGVYTPELEARYLNLASAIEKKTGADGDDVVAALASTQAMIGQTEITDELAKATVDFAAAQKISVGAAFELVAKGINGNVTGFKKLGIELDETSSKSDRLAALTTQLAQRYDGQAETVENATGGVNRLKQAFTNVLEALGERFFPIFQKVTGALGSFFDTLANNPALLDLATALISAGVAVSGIALAISVAVPAFLALKAAVLALGVSFNIAFVGIPLLIGAVVAAITLIALNWDTVTKFVKTATTGLLTFLSEAFSGLGKVLSGAFTLDLSKLKEGLSQVGGALKKSEEAAIETFNNIEQAQTQSLQKQDDGKAKAAAKAAALEREQAAEKQAVLTAQLELTRLQNENASAELIAIKQKEIETLKAITEAKTAAEDAALQERLAIIREQQTLLEAEELERIQLFETTKQELQTQLADQGLANLNQIGAAKLAVLRSQVKTEADIDRQVQEDMLKKRIEIRNQELLDRKKYGAAVAELNKLLNTEEVQGFKSASSELVALTQSKNQTLKSIGKAAAISQIIIGTAESALNIYRGFSAIPIIGPALGVAGAAAAIAFGAERIGQVTSAAEGGLIEGGIPGIDSVPALLMPGELVVPRRNFDDVVGAVQGKQTGGDDAMLDELKKLNETSRASNSITIQGDFLSDDNYVDNMVKKISDAIEFRNAKIVGVNI